MVLRECGICQSSIYPDESTTICPTCGLTFHAECWKENWGCAAYGCEQVNALKPKEEDAKVEEMFQAPIPQAIERLPWNFVLLGLAAGSILLSTLTYGVPSFAVIVAIALRILKVRGRQQRIGAQITLAIAMLLAMIGTISGVVVSRYWHS
jgi:hypothetical protein